MNTPARIGILALAFLILLSLVALGYTPTQYTQLARFLVGALCAGLAYAIWGALK